MKDFKFLIFFTFLCLALPFEAFANKTYNVSHKSFFVPIAVDEQYIELHTWYPTNSRVLLRTIEPKGKQFPLARNAAAIDETLNLIIISPPSFTNTYNYASLAHALACRGFLVALITHIGDNRERMVYTLSGWQLLWRAIEIKNVIEYLDEDTSFTINPETISTISFAETALAPLLLDDFLLNANDYDNFCVQATDDPFCKPPYKGQIERITQSMQIYQEESQQNLDTYDREVQKVRQENTNMQTAWDKATQRALANKEQAPEEPKWLQLPDKPIEADLNASYIKNFFLVEPLFPFLIQAKANNENSIEIFTFTSSRPTIENTSMHAMYLQKLFTHKITELSLEKYNHYSLIDRRVRQVNSNELQFPDLMLNINEREQLMFINSFAKNISENILNY